MRRLDRSVLDRVGVASRNIRTAGTRNISVIPSGPRVRAGAAGSTSRRITERPPRDMAHSAHPDPPMWNSGIATRLTVSSPMVNVSPASPMAVARFAFVSMTPLGSPVVPEVYSCMLTSVGAPTWPGSSRVATREPFFEGHRARVGQRLATQDDDAVNIRKPTLHLTKAGR